MNERKDLIQLLLKDVEKSISEGVVTPEELIATAKAIVSLLDSVKTELSQGIITAHQDAQSKSQKALDAVTKAEKQLLALLADHKADPFTDISEARDRFERQIRDAVALIPTLPDLTYLEQRIEAVRKAIPKPAKPVTAVEVRDKLERLNGESRLSHTAIRGLEDYDEVREASRKKVHIGAGVGAIKEMNGWSNGSQTTYNKLTVSTTQPANPRLNDLWIDTN